MGAAAFRSVRRRSSALCNQLPSSTGGHCYVPTLSPHTQPLGSSRPSGCCWRGYLSIEVLPIEFCVGPRWSPLVPSAFAAVSGRGAACRGRQEAHVRGAVSGPLRLTMLIHIATLTTYRAHPASCTCITSQVASCLWCLPAWLVRHRYCCCACARLLCSR